MEVFCTFFLQSFGDESAVSVVCFDSVHLVEDLIFHLFGLSVSVFGGECFTGIIEIILAHCQL